MTSMKGKQSRRKRSWPNVYKRKHRSGQVGYVVDLGLVNNKNKDRLEESVK